MPGYKFGVSFYRIAAKYFVIQAEISWEKMKFK